MKEDLFRNKYRTQTTRLSGYDYSQPGYYFITICTQNRICYFGHIINGKMVLNKNGEIVKNELLKTEKMRPNVKLDEWIIMPNHIHVIIVVGEIIEMNGKYILDVWTDNCVATVRVEAHCNGRVRVEAHCNAPLHEPPPYQPPQSNQPSPPRQPYQNKFGPQRNNLASIIRGFKSTTTKQINQITKFNYFAWQPRFYDHIVRNEKSLNNIRYYIRQNPAKWWRDRNNRSGLLT
ncbi:MAG: transposase [Patescibacteria group bacterium]